MATILLIEDDREVSHMITTVLRIEGYGVHVARDCVGAIEFLRISLTPALVLLDLITAGAKGPWFLAKMEMDPKLQRIPLIAITDRPLELPGVVGTVQKPFQWAKLLALIERHAST